MPLDTTRPSSKEGRRVEFDIPTKKEKKKTTRSFSQVAIGALNAYNRFNLGPDDSNDTADVSFESGESFDQSDAGRSENTSSVIGVQLVESEDAETVASSDEEGSEPPSSVNNSGTTVLSLTLEKPLGIVLQEADSTSLNSGAKVSKLKEGGSAYNSSFASQLPSSKIMKVMGRDVSNMGFDDVVDVFSGAPSPLDIEFALPLSGDVGVDEFNEETNFHEEGTDDEATAAMDDSQLGEESFTMVNSEVQPVAVSRNRMAGMQNLIAEMAKLKTQIDAELEGANGVMDVLESNLDTAKSENKTLSKKIDLLTDQVATVESEKQKLEQMVEEMTGQISVLVEEMAELTSSLEEKGDEKLELEEVIKEKEHEILQLSDAKNELESRLKEKEDECIKLTANLHDCRSESDNKALEIEALTKENASLREDVALLEASNTDLEELLSSTKNELAEVEANAVTLKEEVAWAKSEIAGLLEAERQLLEYKENAQNQLKSLQEKLTKAEEANGEAERQLLEYKENAKNQLKSLQEKLTKIEEANGDLESMLKWKEEDIIKLAASLQEARSDSDSKNLENERLTRELAEARQQISTMSAESETLVDSLNQRLSSVEEQLEGAKRDNVALEQQKVELRTENKDLEETVDEMLQQYSAMSKENATLLSSLDEKCMESFNLCRRVEKEEQLALKLDKARNDLEVKLEEKVRENAVLLSSLDEKCIESFELERSLDEKKEQVSMMIEQMDALESMLQRSGQRAAELEETVQDSRFDSKNKAREIERLNKELSLNTSVLQESKKNVDSLQNEVVRLSDAAEQVSKLLSDNEGLSNLVEVKTTIIGDLEIQLQEANDLTSVLEKELGTVKFENQALNEKNEELGHQVESIEAKKQDITSMMQEQVAVLEAEKQELTDKMSDASEQISKISSENATLRSSLGEETMTNRDLEQSNEEKQQQVMKLIEEVELVTASKCELEAELKKKVTEVATLEQEMQESTGSLTKQIDELSEQLVAVESIKESLVESSDKMKEQISAITSENATLQTALGEKGVKNQELGQLVTEKENLISKLIEERRLLESDMKTKREQLTQLEKALEEAQSNKKELECQIKEAISKSRKSELDYAASAEKVELLELVISQKDKVAADLLEALNEMMTSSDDRDEELAILTDENNELGAKLDEANVKISRMHAKMQGLRVERNNAIARVQEMISGNSSLLETKVKEVSTRLDSEFAELQQRVESLDADILELQSKNENLERENNKLRKDNDAAQERIASLSSAKKHVTFSATCAPPNDLGIIASGGMKHSTFVSPASSYTSGSGFFDPEVAEQVSKALELAKLKLKKGSE
jgi:chromosome segregation ATPase